MTNKQLTAMRRILDRNFRTHSVYVWRDRYILTDGTVAVVSSTEFPGSDFEIGEQNEQGKNLYDAIMKEVKNGDYVRTQDDLASWRKVARKEEIVQIEGDTSNGEHISGNFNTRLVVDAMDSIGTGSMLYIGKLHMLSSMCGLIVLPKNYTGGETDFFGFVLPTRRQATN